MATKETPKETVDRTDWPFHDKVVYVQEKLNAPKSNENSFGGYKYRSAEDIVEAVKPILRDVNLLLNLTDEVEQIGDRYYVKATATLVDTDRSISSTAYARETEVKKGMDEAQITGSASSYARKYALNGVLAIDDTKDPDTQDNRDHAPAPAAAAPKPRDPGKFISAAQIKLLYARLKEKGVSSVEDANGVINMFTGNQTVAEVKMGEMDKLLEEIGAMPVPTPETPAPGENIQ